MLLNAHTLNCHWRRLKWRWAQRRYQAAYPGFCHTCNATGFTETADWVDYGSSVTPLYNTELCPACTEQGICPRCGQLCPEEDAFLTSTYRCPHCDWCQADAPESYPLYFDCACWDITDCFILIIQWPIKFTRRAGWDRVRIFGR